MPKFDIHHQLEIIPGNKILVPGCEPTSALTSDVLSRSMDCGSAIVDLDAALAAIPGSFVKLGSNYNRGNTRQRWLVLPAIDPSCPCPSYDDYYQILKDTASEEVPVEETFDHCNVIGQGFCPSPDFEMTPAPANNPYVPEGTTPVGVARLAFPPNSLGAS